MNNWMTCGVRYTKQLENGTFKRVSEKHLFAAMTFTDAEARIYEELGAIIRGEFIVVAITRSDYHDIFSYDDCGKWWKCKITFDSQDLDSEKTKRSCQNFLVEASSAKKAFDRCKESLSTMMVDFEIPSITESPIVDIFPYVEQLDKEISRKPLVAETEETVEEESVTE